MHRHVARRVIGLDRRVRRRIRMMNKGQIDPASFPLEFEPRTYRALHSDLWYMPDEQLREHYEARGRAEGRRAHPLAARDQFRDLALTALPILEIGPFFKPLFAGPNVAYFDVLDRRGLIAHALELGFKDVEVPEIDYVSPTGDLSIINRKFEVVASSHVIEHQPNLVRHLQQVEALLQPGGYYFVFIPDKRYCFDHFMPESTIADVIEAEIENRRFHSLRTAIRQKVLATHNEPPRHWHGDHGTAEHLNAESVITAINDYKEAVEAERYIDQHAWQFTPRNFREILELLNRLGLVGLRPLRVYDTMSGDQEFWAILQKGVYGLGSVKDQSVEEPLF